MAWAFKLWVLPVHSLAAPVQEHMCQALAVLQCNKVAALLLLLLLLLLLVPRAAVPLVGRIPVSQLSQRLHPRLGGWHPLSGPSWHRKGRSIFQQTRPPVGRKLAVPQLRNSLSESPLHNMHMVQHTGPHNSLKPYPYGIMKQQPDLTLQLNCLANGNKCVCHVRVLPKNSPSDFQSV